jgi:hypothetical protein
VNLAHTWRPAQPEVVLQRDARVLHLALLGLPAQLPGQLGALGQAHGAQRVALGQQATRRVGDHLAAVGVVRVVHLLEAPRRHALGDAALDGGRARNSAVD